MLVEERNGQVLALLADTAGCGNAGGGRLFLRLCVTDLDCPHPGKRSVSRNGCAELGAGWFRFWTVRARC